MALGASFGHLSGALGTTLVAFGFRLGSLRQASRSFGSHILDIFRHFLRKAVDLRKTKEFLRNS